MPALTHRLLYVILCVCVCGQIVDMIESQQVTVIEGETGCGKTTQVPQYILDEYATQGRYCNIIVTQPRRIAATSIARRVCDERGWHVGRICGYQVLCVADSVSVSYSLSLYITVQCYSAYKF